MNKDSDVPVDRQLYLWEFRDPGGKSKRKSNPKDDKSDGEPQWVQLDFFSVLDAPLFGAEVTEALHELVTERFGPLPVVDWEELAQAEVALPEERRFYNRDHWDDLCVLGIIFAVFERSLEVLGQHGERAAKLSVLSWIFRPLQFTVPCGSIQKLIRSREIPWEFDWFCRFYGIDADRMRDTIEERATSLGIDIDLLLDQVLILRTGDDDVQVRMLNGTLIPFDDVLVSTDYSEVTQKEKRVRKKVAVAA